MGKHHSGIILGLVTGTVLGILFAPKKGKELRDQIKKERDGGCLGVNALKKGFDGMEKDMASSAKNVYESDTIQDNMSKAKEKAKEYAEMGKDKMEQAANDAVKHAKKLSKKASNFTKKKIGK